MKKPSARHADIGLLILRVFVGLRLLYGVIDNIVSWKKMEHFAGFLEQFHFPIPIVSAIVSVYAQAVGGLCILIGFGTRLSAAVMAVNFLVALVFLHLPLKDSVEGITPALAMLFGSVCLLFTGGGKYVVRKENF